MKRPIFSCFILALLSLSAQAEEHVLRIAVQQNPETQEPVDISSNVAFRNNASIHENLVKLDQYNKLQSNLATKWQWVNPTTLEITLRENVKFSNDEPLTAQDVAFSFGPERLTAKTAPGYGAYLANFSSLDHVEVVGPHTVRFITKYPDPVFVERLTSYAAAIISKKGWESDGGDWAKWKQKPVGAGPYKVFDYVANDHVTLIPNPYYFKGKPPADKIIFKVVPEVSARIAGLLAGDYDIATDLPPDQLTSVDKQPGFSVVGGPVPNIRILYFDKNAEVTRDPRVRQALILAIDRQAIVDTIWGGRTVVPNGLQFKQYGQLYDASRPAYKYDPVRAKALLKAAGYHGQEVTIRLRSGYYTAVNQVSDAIVSMWQAIGVNARMQFVDGSQLGDKPAGRVTGNWSSTLMIPEPYVTFFANYGDSGQLAKNKIWSNDEFYKLGHLLEKESDMTKRAHLFSRMLDIIEWEDPGVTVLHQNAVFYGISKHIGWQPADSFAMDFAPGHLSFK